MRKAFIAIAALALTASRFTTPTATAATTVDDGGLTRTSGPQGGHALPPAGPAITPATAPVALTQPEPLDGARCGDGKCQPPEDCNTCPQDCGKCCGDGKCQPPEDCNTCPQDCGKCK